MIRVIFFDLDMCILDTHSLTGPFFDPVLSVLHSSDLSTDDTEKIERALWTTSLDDIVDMFAIPEVTAESLREAYQHIEVPDGIKSYGDEESIRNLPVKKILVTTGYRKFQEAKIAKLGIAGLFDEILIDATDNREQRIGKKKIFQELLKRNGWQPDEVLVVGDNPVSELAAARSLGIVTVQTVRPTISAWPEADYHISSLEELDSLMRSRPGWLVQGG